MSDLHVLLLVLAVIYLWDCLVWVRRGSIAFSSWRGTRWHLRFPAALAGNTRGGLVPVPPLPPLGTVFVTAPPPVSVSTEGVLGFVSASLDPSGRPPQSGRWMPWDKLERLEARGHRVFANHTELCLTGGEASATALVARLIRIREANAKGRDRQLDEWTTSLLDAEAAQSRHREYTAASRQLRWCCNAYFLLLFVVVPAALLRLGPSRSWPYLVGLVLLQGALTARFFYRAHRLLHPAAPDERFTQTIVVLLSPPSGVRALDALSRTVLQDFHPLAVAKALGETEALRSLASRTLRELRFPALPAVTSVDPAVVSAEQDWRHLLDRSITRALRRWGLDPDQILAPPRQQDPACRSWCPRCEQQFTMESGRCQSCGGIHLLAFAPPAAQK